MLASKILLLIDIIYAILDRSVDTLAKAVSVTLGPKGRNVIIEQSYGGPKITKSVITPIESPQSTNLNVTSQGWSYGCQSYYSERQAREPWRSLSAGRRE